jgi:peptidoglycan L-alanyl-D-glutamate endopeptidase CwlK
LHFYQFKFMSDFLPLLPLLLLYLLFTGISAWFMLPAARRQTCGQKTRTHLAVAYARFRRSARNAVMTVAVLAAPAILAILLRDNRVLDAYDDTPQPATPVIAALLHGEHLVPPPSLPPDLFIAREVETIRQNLQTASRDWMALDADFRQRLLTVYRMMARHGYEMALLEGYRSPDRQSFLASRGAHVTNAGAYQSFHQYGLAADSAFLRNGKLVISETDPWAMEGYRLFGEYAQATGLVWGGHWKMRDFGHVELRRFNVRQVHN